MKILIVSPYYAAHGGGVESVIRQILFAMRDTAPQLSFTWAASDCDATVEQANLVSLPMRCSNAIERNWGVRQPFWSFAALKQLAQAVTEHDAVWLHDTLYMGNIAAYVTAKWKRKPIVITQHVGMVPYKNAVFRMILRFGNRFIAAPMLKRANQTVFIADQVRGHFGRRIRKWRRKPRTILNGVQNSIFKTVTDDRRMVLRQKFGIDEQPAMLFVGRFVEKKGLPILKRLTAALPDYIWIFAGRGPLDPADWGLLDQSMVLRDRSGAGVAELYQAADLLVLPSIGEGLPLVIQEAAACGLPVLCAPETAAADKRLAPLLYTGTVVPKDPDSTAHNWVQHLKGIIENTDDRMMRGAELAKFAASQWSWPRTAEQYAEIFARYQSRSASASSETARDQAA